jgi:translation initiation factor 2 beta subunit (eIF-2beta)/eIF-5
MDFNFETMVNEAYNNLEEYKDEILIIPKIETEILPTRLHWKNVKEYLKVINRDPEHFMTYIKYELSGKEINWYSNSKSDGLIIHGRNQKKEISDIAIKYINDHVICSSCKKTNTTITKSEFECLVCGMKKFI